MRLIFTLALLSAAFFGTVRLCAAGQESDLPLRKAGLWEVDTTTDAGRGPSDQKLTMCIGEEMEREAVHSTAMQNRSTCSKYDIETTTDGTTVDAICVYDERQVTNHTEMRGDFKTAFTVKVDSTTAGKAPRSQGSHPVNVHLTISQQGKYLGESCGDLKAGEAKTPDGQTVTVQ